jgi:hypothetical protein
VQAAERKGAAGVGAERERLEAGRDRLIRFALAAEPAPENEAWVSS